MPVPGGVAIVPVASQTTSVPHLTYKGKRVAAVHQGGRWLAVIGLSLKAKPGKHTVRDLSAGTSHAFTVQSKEYEAQHITLKNKRQVNPNKQDMKRINRESKLIKQSLNQPWRQWFDTHPLPLAQPVAGPFSSPFGLKRFFNGQARRPHSGLDIAAGRGTPVKSPAGALVVNTGDYFFNGKSVFLDHGQGMITMYCHLDEILVQTGTSISAGTSIGKVGSTGRATGPHLHWGVKLNDNWIDPVLLLDAGALANSSH